MSSDNSITSEPLSPFNFTFDKIQFIIVVKMAKRRTRKEKLSASHKHLISWSPEPKRDHFEPNVKRQLPRSRNRSSSNRKLHELVKVTDKNIPLASVRKDLTKSFIFAFLIIASEVVIYLVWIK